MIVSLVLLAKMRAPGHNKNKTKKRKTEKAGQGGASGHVSYTR